MGAFLGISLWIALATVIPGLVTIAVVYGAYAISDPQLICNGSDLLGAESSLLWSAVAITIMVLTQAVGILLEELLVTRKWLGGKRKKTDNRDRKSAKIFKFYVPEGIISDHKTEVELDPYKEYKGLYFLIASLQEHEDAHGHLKRALAQFFLTNNTIVSFAFGILTALLLKLRGGCGEWKAVLTYVFTLSACLAVSYWVAVIRFREMVKSLWATRIIRTKAAEKTQQGS